MILTIEEITHSHLNLTEIGLVKFVNAINCIFIQKSIIPTKEKYVPEKISLTFALREQCLKEIQGYTVTQTSGTSVR